MPMNKLLPTKPDKAIYG